MKSLLSLTALLTFGLVQNIVILPVFSQQRNIPLSQAWTDAHQNFVTYRWLSPGGDTIYSSTLYTEISQNTLSIYNTYVRDPFGSNAICGGLGCDLGKGQLIATLRFESQGSRFIIRQTSGRTDFLLGAQCHLVDSYMTVLVCTSNNSPMPYSRPNIFRFSPAS
jgi:hypothetical protein